MAHGLVFFNFYAINKTLRRWFSLLYMNLIFKLFGRAFFKKEAAVKAWGDYFAPRGVKVLWFSTLLINLALWLLAFLIKKGLHQDLAIMHYNVIFGIDYLAPRGQIYFLPLVALLLFIGNVCLSAYLFRKDAFLLMTLLSAGLVANIFVGLALYSIYLVNFVKIF